MASDAPEGLEHLPEESIERVQLTLRIDHAFSLAVLVARVTERDDGLALTRDAREFEQVQQMLAALRAELARHRIDPAQVAPIPSGG